MAKSVKELLSETCDFLVNNPDSWTTEFYAEDQDQNPVEIDSAKACRFCPLGRLRLACGVPWDVGCHTYDATVSLLDAAAQALFQQDKFELVNDHPDLGYEAALKCFEWAIERA